MLAESHPAHSAAGLEKPLQSPLQRSLHSSLEHEASRRARKSQQLLITPRTCSHGNTRIGFLCLLPHMPQLVLPDASSKAGALLPAALRPATGDAVERLPLERHWFPGYCAETSIGASDCETGYEGSWQLPASQFTSEAKARTACLARCESCRRCAYVSVSRLFRDCSWYAHCAPLRELPNRIVGFETAAMHEYNSGHHTSASWQPPPVAWQLPLRAWRALGCAPRWRGPSARHCTPLWCAAQRLAEGEPTTIAFLGTSITAGNHRSDDSSSFTSLVQPLLAQRYPQANGTLTVATHGYPGASPMCAPPILELSSNRRVTAV